jgi:hypothetical protein
MLKYVEYFRVHSLTFRFIYNFKTNLFRQIFADKLRQLCSEFYTINIAYNCWSTQFKNTMSMARVMGEHTIINWFVNELTL